jgi:two-component system, OmpR family, sensor histidine kinase KdpD
MERPDPDEILAKVKTEESHRGVLKIFFGAVAGVGKTYTMLEAARSAKKEGIDVVVGYAETHKRLETEALLEGLEILPYKAVAYKNVSLREFDIDAAIKRNPKLILVDELAHTNAPGSRHPKRWQDIEELLAQGIDVYTTLNVQHCESANDIVAQVTGIRVRETVPDTFIEQANEIELVDLPREELLKRLKEGKVYLGEQAQRAAEHFFQPGNLIALRQLALRFTERNVDTKLMSYKKEHAVSTVWNVRDRFLVCISASPSAIRLIRACKRIASDLGVEWIVAYVEPITELPPEDKHRVAEMMHFAEKLGASVTTLAGQDVAETLIAYARLRNVTKIIMGKPGKPRLREFFVGSIFDRLARKCGEIDLYLLSGDVQEQPFKFKKPVLQAFSWNNLGWACGVIILCTLVNWGLILSHISLVNLLMIYLLGVTWVAFRYGRRISMITSFLSVLLFDFLFVPPYFTFAVADFEYVVTLIVMLGVGFTIAQLAGQLKRQTAAMIQREERTKTLYALSRDLAKSSYPNELFKISLKHIKDFFKCEAMIFVPDKIKKLIVQFGEAGNLGLNENELAVAQWVYEHKKPAGNGTDTLPGSSGMYLPFLGVEKTVGVLGIFPDDEKQFIDPEQLHILEMFVSQTASAVEGAQLAATALEAVANVENERLKNLLLTTFSSGLAEPLTAISHTLAELLKPENFDNEIIRVRLIGQMRKEAGRLNILITELPEIIESEQ